MNVMGARRTYRLAVTEPEPGRVLQEDDPAAGLSTRFTLTPLDGGARTRVTITTDWTPGPGFRGFMERLINPGVTRRIYREELELLEAVASSRVTGAGKS
jgi:hypothetical protein